MCTCAPRPQRDLPWPQVNVSTAALKLEGFAEKIAVSRKAATRIDDELAAVEAKTENAVRACTLQRQSLHCKAHPAPPAAAGRCARACSASQPGRGGRALTVACLHVSADRGVGRPHRGDRNKRGGLCRVTTCGTYID